MKTPATNSHVSLRFIRKSAPMVAIMDVTLEVMLVVSAEVFTVHMS